MKKPNFVLIMADDMGYGDFGIFSEGRVSTPFLDSLVGESVCLSQNYTGKPGMLTISSGDADRQIPHQNRRRHSAGSSGI